jgi:hypothetical protein
MGAYRANDFIVKLEKAGVIPPMATRVIIDAASGEALKIYVATLETEALMRLELPELKDAQIIMAGSE